MLILVTSVRPHVRLWPASVALLKALLLRNKTGSRQKEKTDPTLYSQDAAEGGNEGQYNNVML